MMRIMTLTEKDLREWEESTFTPFTSKQRQIILDRFGTEPEPYEWSEQDIAEQVDRICMENPAPKPKEPIWTHSR
jgi:hypothetical protein